MNGNCRSFSFRILVNRVAAFLARPAELDFLQYGSPAGLSLAEGAISNLNLHRGKADFLTDWNLLTILDSIFHVQ